MRSFQPPAGSKVPRILLPMAYALTAPATYAALVQECNTLSAFLRMQLPGESLAGVACELEGLRARHLARAAAAWALDSGTTSGRNSSASTYGKGRPVPQEGWREGEEMYVGGLTRDILLSLVSRVSTGVAHRQGGGQGGGKGEGEGPTPQQEGESSSTVFGSESRGGSDRTQSSHARSSSSASGGGRFVPFEDPRLPSTPTATHPPMHGAGAALGHGARLAASSSAGHQSHDVTGVEGGQAPAVMGGSQGRRSVGHSSGVHGHHPSLLSTPSHTQRQAQGQLTADLSSMGLSSPPSAHVSFPSLPSLPSGNSGGGGVRPGRGAGGAHRPPASTPASLSFSDPTVDPSFLGSLSASAHERLHGSRRTNLSDPSKVVLRAWFMLHLSSPYPSEGDKVGLARQAGTTVEKVSNWFINARARDWDSYRAASASGGSSTAAHAHGASASASAGRKRGRGADGDGEGVGHTRARGSGSSSAGGSGSSEEGAGPAKHHHHHRHGTRAGAHGHPLHG